MAGVVVLASVASALVFTPWWLLLTAFVGVNLVFYAAAGWCPASLLMERAGLARTDCRARSTSH
ncbi:hypothetical protein GCM10011610_27240 [Nocardia rhizosphaerihabitans]|uniref:Inner membrane protein YgaP-like transmembrane domain-containing protein n=2 Tax=Nocardia rhizosphaerihabitans TaxID=1691570 RepID=A0ABQ2KF58_9NOCA|nr:hypothetical protein GCM10011610_27240 [Nocardia rhizosphaerihabitans]